LKIVSPSHLVSAEQLLTSGLGTQEDIDAIAAAWREWAAHPDGWISVLHGELLIRVP
jgi:hypothetical protein